MKKIFFCTGLLLLFSGCTASQENIDTVDFGDSLDLTNIFAQVCENKNGPCKNISCTLFEDVYSCYENVSKREENCSSIKTKDEVIGKYKICGLGVSETGEPLNSENYSIFNYGQSLELFEMGKTPAEFEQKIEEELQTVEQGGSSDFLSTMLAVAGGSILGGMISNAIFNRNSAIPPQKPASSYEQPFKKDDLNKSKEGVKANESKITDSVEKTQQKSKNTAKKTAAQKKATTTKKSSSSKKRTRRRP